MKIFEKIKSKLEELNKFIFILSILFGISSWIVFAGIWVEAPLLMRTMPESWKLPSMIGAVAQFGQIGPIMLYVMKCQMFSCCPGRFLTIRKKRVPDRYIIYGLFLIGLVSLAVIALFWDKTVWISGKHRSLPFFFGVFFLAILDCSCTIVFLTYIGKFKQNYVTALYIGEGISSLIPSLFALAQGTGGEEKCTNNATSSITSKNYTIFVDQTFFKNETTSTRDSINPNFSVSVYFWLLFVTLFISLASFTALDKVPYFTKHKISKKIPEQRYDDDDINEEESTQNKPLKNVDNKDSFAINSIKNKHSKKSKYLLYTAITLVSFLLYGFIPGLSSYAAQPYGPRVMHLSVTLALITQPISSLLATFVQFKSIKKIYFLLAVSFLITIYIIVMSVLSPCPLLKSHVMGGIIMVTCWILCYGFLMYLRCCITAMLKRNYGEKSLMACGLLTQIGQFIGSILIYLLVDLAELFKEAKLCEIYEC